MVLKKGARVIDNDGLVGVIIEYQDEHNVHVKTEKGLGLYCLVKSCEYYDPIEETE